MTPWSSGLSRDPKQSHLPGAGRNSRATRTAFTEAETNATLLLGVNLARRFLRFDQHFRWNATILAGVEINGVIAYLVSGVSPRD